MATSKNQDVLKAMAEYAARDGNGDQWKVKIYRRLAPLGQDVHVAFFEVATLLQLANAEQWLPSLAGGGPYYLLEVTHHSQTLAGWFLIYMIEGEARAPNFQAEKAPDWRGPRNIFLPPAPPPKQQNSTGDGPPVFQSSSGPSQVTGPLNSLPQGGPPVTVEARLSAMEAEYQRRLDGLDRERADRRHKAELEEMERRFDEKMRRERSDREAEVARAKADATAQQAQQRPADTGGGLPALLTALTPLAQQVMSATAEMRKVQMEQSHALALKAQETQLELARRSEETLKLVLSVNEKKSAIDPELRALLQQVIEKKDSGAQQGELMAAMAESFGRMSHTLVTMIQSTAELRQEDASPAESEAYKIVRMASETVGKVVDTITKNMNPQARFRVPPQPAAQLPQQAQQPQQPQAAAAQGAPQGAPQGAVPVPQPGAPQQAAPTPAPAAPAAPLPVTAMDRLERRIRDKNNPYEVAQNLISAIQTDVEVQMELSRAEGNIFTLFESRLGQPWLQEHPGNMIYANQLRVEIIRQGQEAGLLPKEGEEDEEDAAVEAPNPNSNPNSNGASAAPAVPAGQQTIDGQATPVTTA